MSTAPVKIEVMHPASTLGHPLTDSERRILGEVFNGKSNRDIGLVLGLSEQTIKHSMHLIYQKLGINGVRGLFPWVIAGGMELRTGKSIESLQ